MGAAQPLDRLVGPPARLQQIVDTPPCIAAAEIGVIAAPGAAGHGEDEDALSPAMKAAVSARLAEAGRLRSARRSPDESAMRSTRRERPVTSATASPPKRWRIWSNAACTGGNAASFSINASRGGHGFLAQDRVAPGVGHRPRHQVALVVGERSCNCTGKAWARYSRHASRGVRSTEMSSHSETGISACAGPAKPRRWRPTG